MIYPHGEEMDVRLGGAPWYAVRIAEPDFSGPYLPRCCEIEDVLCKGPIECDKLTIS
jgi:hypothetical protein